MGEVSVSKVVICEVYFQLRNRDKNAISSMFFVFIFSSRCLSPKFPKGSCRKLHKEIKERIVKNIRKKSF